MMDRQCDEPANLATMTDCNEGDGPGGAAALEEMRGIDRRIVTHLTKKGSTDRAATSMVLDPLVFTSALLAERELERIFRKSPLVACLSADVAAPGEIFLFDELGVSIIITRNKAGQAAAFLNMCTHRAARLVNDCKTRARITCPFHGWTFDLNGRLIGLPDQESFPDVVRASRGLVSIPVAEAHGIIFIVPDARAEPICIEEYLGEFGEKLSRLQLSKARLVKTDRVETNANWKYVLDTYEESYHNVPLHPDTFGKSYHNSVLFTKYGQHQRVNFIQRTYDNLIGRHEDEWPKTPYGGLHLVFPSTIINRDIQSAGERVLIVRVYPDGADKCVTYLSTYRIGESTATDEEHLAVHDMTVRVVTTEDYSVSESGQHNLHQAPEGFTTVLGRNEVALQEFHRNVAAALGE